jgi:hypothetical protein
MVLLSRALGCRRNLRRLAVLAAAALRQLAKQVRLKVAVLLPSMRAARSFQAPWRTACCLQACSSQGEEPRSLDSLPASRLHCASKPRTPILY